MVQYMVSFGSITKKRSLRRIWYLFYMKIERNKILYIVHCESRMISGGSFERRLVRMFGRSFCTSHGVDKRKRTKKRLEAKRS